MRCNWWAMQGSWVSGAEMTSIYPIHKLFCVSFASVLCFSLISLCADPEYLELQKQIEIISHVVNVLEIISLNVLGHWFTDYSN